MVSRPATSSSPHAFLPDLSGIQPVFLLVLLGELLAIVLTLADSGIRPFDWERLGALSFLIQWIVLLSAALLTLVRPWLAQRSVLVAGTSSYLLVLLVILVSASVGQWLFPNEDEFRWQPLLTALLIGAIVSGVALRYLHLQQELALQKQAELNARISALQARIRPHFLFNGMNTIASLIATDPDKAETLIVDLASLFRASLAEPGLVTLGQELDLCRHYLAIEQSRLGARLQLDWQVDDSLLATPLPSLLVQPLLENAVYHGIQPHPDGGKVTVRVMRQAHRSGDQLLLIVTNPQAPTVALREGNGMALNNIRGRLQALYGERASVQVASGEGEFRVSLQIPVQGPIAAAIGG